MISLIVRMSGYSIFTIYAKEGCDARMAALIINCQSKSRLVPTMKIRAEMLFWRGINASNSVFAVSKIAQRRRVLSPVNDNASRWSPPVMQMTAIWLYFEVFDVEASKRSNWGCQFSMTACLVNVWLVVRRLRCDGTSIFRSIKSDRCGALCTFQKDSMSAWPH